MHADNINQVTKCRGYAGSDAFTEVRVAEAKIILLLTINTVFSLVGFVDRVVLIFSLGLEPSSSTFFFFDFFLFYLCDEESCRHLMI